MISVIVPSFNEEENIAQCLVSLSHQTVSRNEYEIIVVDGASTDKTCEIARKCTLTRSLSRRARRSVGHETTV